MRITLMLGIGCGLGARREVGEDNVAVCSVGVVDSPVRHRTIEHECITGLDSLRVELIALQLLQLRSWQLLLVVGKGSAQLYKGKLWQRCRESGREVEENSVALSREVILHDIIMDLLLPLAEGSAQQLHVAQLQRHLTGVDDELRQQCTTQHRCCGDELHAAIVFEGAMKLLVRHVLPEASSLLLPFTQLA